jgi:hypothetical protein
MLRAIGFGTGLIRTAMLSEAGLIAVRGTFIGDSRRPHGPRRAPRAARILSAVARRTAD